MFAKSFSTTMDQNKSQKSELVSAAADIAVAKLTTGSNMQNKMQPTSKVAQAFAVTAAASCKGNTVKTAAATEIASVSRTRHAKTATGKIKQNAQNATNAHYAHNGLMQQVAKRVPINSKPYSLVSANAIKAAVHREAVAVDLPLYNKQMSMRSHFKEMPGKMATSHSKNAMAIENLETRIPEISRIFDIEYRIGSGTFSNVLLATLKRERQMPEHQRRKFAIKHHNGTSNPDRIIRELECMCKIGGTENILGINCCIRYNDSVAFIMPYLEHDRFHEFYRLLTFTEVQQYMRNLLVALRHVHKFNVIHRDVKPSNILYNQRTREFLLCDFGLAQRLAPDGSIVESTDLSKCSTTTTTTLAAQNYLNMEADSMQMRIPKANNSQEMHTKYIRGMIGTGVDANNTSKTFIISPRGGIDGGIFESLYAMPNAAAAATAATTKSTAIKTQTDLSMTQVDLKTYKKDTMSQKCDINKLLNRLRYTSREVNVNNYVINAIPGKREQHASRAGTPGYRPPEVLLRYPQQTTAVDVWAAGVIFLSILSTVHPFFKAPNDCNALSEIMNLFGDLIVRKTAFLFDRVVMLPQKLQPLDLRRVCMRFRYSDIFNSSKIFLKHCNADGTFDYCDNCEQAKYNCLCHGTNYNIENYELYDMFPASAYDLLKRLLEINPSKRITAEEALKHPFFTDTSCKNLTNNADPCTISITHNSYNKDKQAKGKTNKLTKK